MKTKKLMAVVLLSIAAFGAAGQTNLMPLVTNWGNTVCGSALSITLTNDIVASGTNTTLNCWVKNTSTNLVGFRIWVSMQDFYIILTNNSGTLYELTRDPEKIEFGSAMAGSIMPGHTNLYQIPLSLKQDIKPGNYKLVASRNILVERKLYKLVSNTLEIRVE